MRRIAPFAVRVQTAPVRSTIWLAGGTRVLFGDSGPGVGVGVGVGVGGALDVVKLQVGPTAV